ncbi:MAG: hypothetical protein RIR48_3576 [Bacteroidota bacterium]
MLRKNDPVYPGTLKVRFLQKATAVKVLPKVTKSLFVIKDLESKMTSSFSVGTHSPPVPPEVKDQ